jgi:hypothetical protein
VEDPARRLGESRAAAPTSSCGVRIGSSEASSISDAVAAIKRDLGTGDFVHILTFFSAEHNVDDLNAALCAEFRDIPITGCSTAGEICPTGMLERGIVAIAFPRDGFRIHTGLIENVSEFGIEHASEVVRGLKAKLKSNSDTRLSERAFGVMLVDGLSNAEETLVAAVHWAFDDMQLVGGSAGDGLAFRHTAMIHDRRIVRNGAVLIMIESDFPFRIFKTQNFEPTPIKLVVTAADATGRVVHELNAEPAAREYASAIGLMEDDLGPLSFASYPLVVKVGGDYYCRSIRNMNADGSLSFFCAIDEGLVFTVARPQDMLNSTEKTFEDIDESLGGIDFVLGFDCVLRRLDAETRQIRRAMEDLYKKHQLVGFHTYGEQLNAMHLNQTLTGVAFGSRGAEK